MGMLWCLHLSSIKQSIDLNNKQRASVYLLQLHPPYKPPQSHRSTTSHPEVSTRRHHQRLQLPPSHTSTSTYNNASNTQILPPRLHRLRRYVPLLLLSLHPPLTPTPVFAFSYTFVVASKEGAAMDMARTRWQHQHASARNVLSGGVTGLEGQ